MNGQSRARRLRTITFLIVIANALAGVGIRAQSPSTMNSAPAITAGSSVTIPFELVTRHIMVKVKVNNSRPLSFVLDTGDKVGVIDAEVAKQLGLTLQGQIRVGGAGAETLSASMVKDGNWTLPGLERFSQPLTLALPLGEATRVNFLAGSWGSGPDTLCVVDEHFLVPDKDRLFATIIAKDAGGREVMERTHIKGHC